MRRLIFGFIILLLAIWIGFLIHKDSGYVLVAYEGWTIETSLWVALVCLILFFLILYFLLRLIRNTRLLGSKFQRWGYSRKQNKSRKLTNLGLCEVAEGHWEKAETLLIKSAKDSNTPLINYLVAARAAQEQMADDRRDNYLRQAIKSTSGSELAVGLTQAQLQINSKQWEQALATLKHLYQISPSHVFTLKLLHRVYLELQDWQQLYELLPALKKYKVLNEQKLQSLEEKIYIALLAHHAKAQNFEQMQQLWKKLPKAWRHNPNIAATYVHYLIESGHDDQAISIIEDTLKKQWSPILVSLFGNAKGSKESYQLKVGESWLKKHPNEPELLICLGKLALRERFLGKAKQYFEDFLQIQKSRLALQYLARVYEALGDNTRALKLYNQAFEK